MLKGRLGLETARIPQIDRHGVMWLGRGNLLVEDGTLRFIAGGDDSLAPGEYLIPFQTISRFLLGPGTTLSHDAMRLMARHGTGMVFYRRRRCAHVRQHALRS
jgi:CRISP-associated protein Cas1